MPRPKDSKPATSVNASANDEAMALWTDGQCLTIHLASLLLGGALLVPFVAYWFQSAMILVNSTPPLLLPPKIRPPTPPKTLRKPSRCGLDRGTRRNAVPKSASRQMRPRSTGMATLRIRTRGLGAQAALRLLVRGAGGSATSTVPSSSIALLCNAPLNQIPCKTSSNSFLSIMLCRSPKT